MKEHEKHKKNGVAWLIIPASAVLLAFIINAFLIVNAIVPSPSMSPTLSENSLILGDRLSYRKSAPGRGDIILFTHPELGRRLIVKRVIGIGGDTVRIESGVTYLNGEALDEPYAVDMDSVDDTAVFSVPDGCLFVMGDNRDESFDSRFFDDPFIEEDQVKAKVILKYFPGVYLLS